jgi:hypothetical protein
MCPSTFFQEKRLPNGASEAFTLYSLEWLRGLQCTETAILAVPFRYSLADALAA